MSAAGSWGRAITAHLRTRAAVRRCARIALVVGTLLSVVNQGDVILNGDISAAVAAKIVVNFLVPFCVSSLGYITALRAQGS